MYWQAWQELMPADNDDADLAFRRLARQFGLSARKAERAYYGFRALRSLPGLSKRQMGQWFLDLDRIIAIGDVLYHVDDEVFAAADEALLHLFTPRRRNQHLPDPARIRRVIEEVLDRYYEPEEEQPQPEDEYRLTKFGQRGYLSWGLDAVTMEAIDQAVRKRAALDGISFAQALAALILDPVSASVVINTFRTEGGSLAFLPGYGPVNPEESRLNVRHRDVGPGSSGGYQPSSPVRTFVEGRDGVCRWPGCNVPAQRCQLDHRIEYERGGATSTDNLVALCQHHHNAKTDKRAFYIMDPATGEIYWLFEDGTWEVTEPEGVIAAEGARWGKTVREAREFKRSRKQMSMQESG